MSTEHLSTDLNATIANAVTARIEAEVTAALSGDEVIGKYVSAALQEPVEVKNNRTYRTEKVPYLRHTLNQAFRAMVKDALARVLEEERETIEAEIRKALKRESGAVAEKFTAALTERAAQSYGITVDVKIPGGGDL